jgi:sugar lactone lactonase YvrE
VTDGTVVRFTRSGALDEVGRVPADLPPAVFHVDPDGRVLYATATPDGAAVFALI